LVVICFNWDLISSVSTLVGVLVALFLPFFISWKEKKNIKKILLSELNLNFDLVKKAFIAKANSKYNISKISLQVGVLKEIDLSSWENLKVYLAAQDSNYFIKVKNINDDLLKAKNYANAIYDKNGDSPMEIHLIPFVIEEIKANYERDFKSIK